MTEKQILQLAKLGLDYANRPSDILIVYEQIKYKELTDEELYNNFCYPMYENEDDYFANNEIEVLKPGVYLYFFCANNHIGYAELLEKFKKKISINSDLMKLKYFEYMGCEAADAVLYFPM